MTARVWVVRCKVGVFWDGPTYMVGVYHWRWMADLAARWHLISFPYRVCRITPMPEDDWHPWPRGGRWVERRVLASWFCDHPIYRQYLNTGEQP